jgi:ribosomal protein S6--L-glutamate ligase
MKIGVIGLLGKWSSEQLVEEIQNQGHQAKIIEMENVVFDLQNKKISYMGEDLEDYDGFIIKKLGAEYSAFLYDRLEVLDYLEAVKKKKFFPNPDKVRRLINRYSCTKELCMGDIPLPETTVTENVEEAVKKLSEYGEAIVKPLFTSKSRGMIKIKSDETALVRLENFQKEFNTIYLQKVVKHPGYDLGVCFLGEQYIGTYARVGNKDGWNTTTRHGGHYEQKQPNQEIIDLAKKARDIFDLVFTCVDVVETDEGAKVFEVSAFGGFKGLKESAGMNLAKMYAEYVIKELEN